MKFHITGLNHRTAPVEVRERLAFSESALPAALVALKSCPGFLEGVILSTCNRVEVALASDDASDPTVEVERFLAAAKSVPRESLAPHLYHYDGDEAIRHLFRVASSLDSMVVGEPQILGQLKGAFQTAKAAGSIDGFLEALFARAFSVAKRVRSETEIGQSAVSVSYAAVELAREIFGSLAGRAVLLVGAGKMSELAARHLRRAGADRILVTNRTPERAREMAALFDGTIIAYEAFTGALPEVDIVITSSAAPHYILRCEDMTRVLHARRNRPMFLIDIAVPRNIDPAINKLDNVFLYDIDDLGRVVETNRQDRLKEAAEAESIIAEEVDRMVERLRTREMVPVIVSLQEQLEQIRLTEIERLRPRLGALTPRQEEALEALTRGIINKIAHAPISELRRQAANPHGLHIVETIRKVFRLG
jgi:glutamyl-tRNA reductase